MTKPRIYSMPVAVVYPHILKKMESKGHTHAELDEIIRWLTGYTQVQLDSHLGNQTDYETFFNEAPKLNPARKQITGWICGVRVQDIEDPTMQEIRYLDKLVDELVHGKPMEKVLRK